MKKAVLIALFAVLTLSEVFAGNLLDSGYVQGDVIIGFRSTSVANSNLVVDLGSISIFTNASPNQRLTFTSQFSTNQLYIIGLNYLGWDAFTWIDNGLGTSVILYVSNKRSVVGTQAVSPNSASGLSQESVEGEMSLVQNGASGNYPGSSSLDTTTAVLEPDNDSRYGEGQSYDDVMTGFQQPQNGGYNFSVTLSDPISCEQTNAFNFTSAATVTRADFYQVSPDPSGVHTNITKYLGYFEMNTNGLLSYVAYPVGAPTVPVIQSITRAGTLTSVSFSTGTSGTYTLRGTNSAGLSVPRTNWPAITYGLGTGSPLTLRDTNSASAGFYVITAQ